MSKRRSQRRKPFYPRQRSSTGSRAPIGGAQLTTPEGDPVAFTSARYRHAARKEICALLQQTDEFKQEDALTLADEPRHFDWFETRPDAPAPFAPIGRRILAHLTVTLDTLEVEAFSRRRLDDCRRRLEQLLGERIQLIDIEVKDMKKALREKPQAEPEAPFIPPPEFVAELEEKMLRQWIDESIPALGGLTPREAVKTPEGRQQVLALLDHIAQMQEQMPKRPGTFSPDYRKTKKMLGLA